MIDFEKFKFKIADEANIDHIGPDLLEPVLINLGRLRKQLDSATFDPAGSLSSQELITFNKFVFPKRKIEWLGGRLAAKYAAILLKGREPTPEIMREWVVKVDPHGRPYFGSSFNGTPELSISHSHGLASALVKEDGKCGLDLQKISEATVRVRERFCTAGEEQIIASLACSDSPSFGLTLLWSAKEALRKARGGHPLTGFLEMLLSDAIKVGSNSWLFKVRVKEDSYRIIASFHKDFALAICSI